MSKNQQCNEGLEILIKGPVGCGKTTIANAIRSYCLKEWGVTFEVKEDLGPLRNKVLLKIKK